MLRGDLIIIASERAEVLGLISSTVPARPSEPPGIRSTHHLAPRHRCRHACRSRKTQRQSPGNPSRQKTKALCFEGVTIPALGLDGIDRHA